MDGAKTERAKKKAASDGQRKHGCYLLVLVLLLLTFGLIMLFSASYAYAYYHDNDSFFITSKNR